jgi:acetyl esterase/lipase/lysophospholipase L1-like esterase
MKFSAKLLRCSFVLLFIMAGACSAAVDKGGKRNTVADSITYTLPGKQLMAIAQKVLYKKTPQEDMYLYVLYPPVNKRKKPAIVYFTGGGWNTGNVADEIPTAAWFRDHGIIGITVDYRVKSRHGTTPLECIMDAKSAMRYIRGHAGEFGIDPNKIIAAGGSAGGHLAICTLLDGGDDPADNLKISAKPNGLVLHNPVLGEGFGTWFLDKHPEFTPLKNISTGWPPTIISNGTIDDTTPYAGAEKFARLMHEAGNVCELIAVKDAGHSCDWPVNNPNFMPTLTYMVSFLQEYELLPSRQKADSIGTGWEKFISLDRYLLPFWKADTITEEISQVIKKDGNATGTLLFDAKRVLSVRSADLQKTYTEGKDWLYKDGGILLTANSSIPFFSNDELFFHKEIPGLSMAGKAAGTFVLFSESPVFWSKQISVTYIPQSRRAWKGPVPVFNQNKLAVTIGKLKNKQKLKVVFYGNSIETGCNSSGFLNYAPFMPSWPELIIYNLRHKYKSEVTFSNQSVGGKMAQWGSQEVVTRVVPQAPDLVIIGFGMNDGTFGVKPEEYRRQIKAIMDSISARNHNVEFILIAPMLANPLAIQNGNQGLYKAQLDKLSRKGVVVADITGVHLELLKFKNYQDMTGNNVNHPNDYLARWYAQFISGLLIKKAE